MSNYKKNISIVFSNHCNMDIYGGCSYCCIQKRGSSTVLDSNVVIQKIEETGLENINIVEFMGGEPTIHYDEIYSIVSKYPSLKYRMYTNGLFNFEKWKNIIPLFYEICFSQDGPDKFNSKRGIKNMKYVYDLSLSNLKKMLEITENITVAIVPSTSFHYENLVYITNFYKKLGVKSFSIEIPSVIKDSFVNNSIKKEDFLNLFKYFLYNLELLLYNGEVFLVNIPKEFSSKQINSKGCSDTNIAISPSGKSYYCRDTAANENSLLESNSIKFYNKESIKKIEETNTCHVKFLQGFSSDIYNNTIFNIIFSL